MNKIFTASLLALCVITSSGCYKYAIKVGAGANAAGAPDKQVWTHHFVNGLVGDGAIDVGEVCPTGDAAILIERNLVDAVLTNVTGGVLWAPSTVSVYCGGKTAHTELDADEVRALAQTDAFDEAVSTLYPDAVVGGAS